MCSARVSNKAIRQQLSHSQRAYDVPFLNDVSISKWVILRRSRRTPDQLTSTHPVPNFSATKIVSYLAMFRSQSTNPNKAMLKVRGFHQAHKLRTI